MAVQRQTASTRTRIGKWMGVALGAFAVAVDQQVASITVYARCPDHSTTFVLGLGVFCFLLALLGAGISAQVRRTLRADEEADVFARTDRFIATLSVAFACVSALVILFGTAASLFLQCER